ncbi:MAG: 3-methylcrotonyl-CoA carboxylase, partial [Alphaproteobacteria bacterium]|nr:3-methylcrotonyl-CoA carboxylase [Alphaproteobacteria bacterium]
FNSVEGWALNDDGHDEIRFADGERAVVIPVAYRGAGWELALPGGKIAARGDRDPSGGIAVDLNGRRVAGRVAIDGRNMTVSLADRAWRFQLEDPLDVAGADEAAAGDAVVAPMTGKIVKVLVRPGEQVSRGQALLVLEAMKMEHTLTAKADRSIANVSVREGEQIEEGSVMIAFGPKEEK